MPIFIVGNKYINAMKQRMMKPCVETGSFVNMMMSNNNSVPEVGRGATLLGWSDRHAYEVMSVSPDGKTVVVQQYLPERIDTNGMSECQEYKYEKLTGMDEIIVWKWGAWRKEINYLKVLDEDAFYARPRIEMQACYDDNGFLVYQEGLTQWVKRYEKVYVLWGVKDEYYDYSF